MEVWKSVVGFDGDYEVSDTGRVRSWKNRAPRILSPGRDGSGYPQVNLCKNGNVKSCKIHRLVCDAFLNNPESKRTVNHKNGIKTDNRLKNLEWATDLENQRHSWRVLGRKPSKPSLGKFGKKHHRSKEVIQLDLAGNEVARFGSGHEAERAGFDQGSISYCCSGKLNTHRGFKWRYA